MCPLLRNKEKAGKQWRSRARWIDLTRTRVTFLDMLKSEPTETEDPTALEIKKSPTISLNDYSLYARYCYDFLDGCLQ